MLSKRPRWRRLLYAVLIPPVLLYAVLTGLLWAGQERMLFPGHRTQGRQTAQVTPPEATELVRLTTEGGEQITALFGPATDRNGKPLPDAARKPTVLLFYGNGTWLRAALPSFEKFRRQGYNVLVPEYVGYGLSSGTAGERGFYATAEAAYQHLRSRPDVRPDRIIAVGYSLGGAVAIDLAARHPVTGVAVFNTFTSLAEVASGKFPFVPVSLLLRHRFESRKKLADVRCPLFIASGDADILVPPAMSDDLAAAAQSPVARLRVPDADHNDLFSPRYEEVFAAFRTWTETLPR